MVLVVIKKDGSRETFDRNKILSGIIKACEKRPVPLSEMEKVVDDIERGLNNMMEKEVKSTFIGELVKANVSMARICFGGCTDIHPGIVKIPTEMKSDYGLAALANSITLTPGTITMEVTEEEGQNYLYVHWIDVKETDPEKAGEAIKGTLEKGLRGVWQ
jgi:hypothetical protein